MEDNIKSGYVYKGVECLPERDMRHINEYLNEVLFGFSEGIMLIL